MEKKSRLTIKTSYQKKNHFHQKCHLGFLPFRYRYISMLWFFIKSEEQKYCQKSKSHECSKSLFQNIYLESFAGVYYSLFQAVKLTIFWIFENILIDKNLGNTLIKIKFDHPIVRPPNI